ncbi:MAG: hypothetical protein LBS52_03460 [Dysgonamonadaceae bacterium]|jgi:hypothetical protein|nr:hypothetical protein [Dysgonamonadaceae bacterium]
MKLIDLIVEILQHSSTPLLQSEILDAAKAHKDYLNCSELQQVKVQISAIARALSKYSVGTNPIIGISSEKKDKASFKRFFLRCKQYDGVSLLAEIDLHPYLVKFAYERFGVYCKTINALKTINTKNKIGKWTNPDIVGLTPVILSLNPLFQKEIQKLGLFSTKVIEFYSFELKIRLDKSNITEAYFQAVSNSTWANYGFLVVEDYENDKVFLDNLARLNNAYGIGLIKLNVNNPSKSEIVVSARFNETADINFMNFLSSSNNDFFDFVETSISIIENKEIDSTNFDKIMN